MGGKMEAAATWEAIDSLTPWDRNPRKNDHAVQTVADSIRRFGFGSPILARAADRVVIGGHTRLKAAQKLGLDKVPVRFLDLDPAEAAALALADNKLGELAEWDDEAVAEILGELEQQGTPIDGLGWDDDELKALLGDGIEAAPPSDDAPEVDEEGEPDSTAGTLYQLGPHRLVCGDCLSNGVRDAAIAGGIDAVVTDPPYGIGASKMMMGKGQSRIKKSKRLNNVNEWDAEAPDVSWLLGIAETVIVWGGNYFPMLPVSDDWLVWHKKNDGLSFSEAELAWSNTGKRVRVLSHHWSGEKKQHITQKPLQVMAWCVDMLDAGAVVFDPFGGSGTTLMACAQTGRVARVIELDPRYCDVIRRRWTMWATANGIDPGPGALAPREVPDGD
jgi:hypothetical protein